MKLRRAWPATIIWGVFLLFDILMVGSYSYFLGLFPANNLMVTVSVFTVITILLMNIITLMAGKACDGLQIRRLRDNAAFKAVYFILIVLIIGGGIWYRLELLFNATGDVTGKYSLYENAMVGSTNITPEFDLLSIVYSGILKSILFFTGNIISVPFFFQTACFAIFMICSFLTVYMLLGMAAAFVFTGYIAFMPMFTQAFSKLTLTTDYLFMAMFGIELLFVALFLRGAYLGRYKSFGWVIWYLITGAVIGYMAYVDAGTIIMILPFILSVFVLYDKKTLPELARVVFILIGAAAAFFGMVTQEAGIENGLDSLSGWASYYFHNLNTFSTFWTYTDNKILYLITVIIMSGVIVGFWKNRKVEKISPWLLSMLFIFATVPFMGATRMNTQTFVTVYYAFIIGCVASLITLPKDEAGETAETATAQAESADDAEAQEESVEAADTQEETAAESGASANDTQDAAAVASDNEYIDEKKDQPVRYVPEGMVLPEDDEDVDLTPRMKMPEFKGNIGADGKMEKLKVTGTTKLVEEAPVEEPPVEEPPIEAVNSYTIDMDPEHTDIAEPVFDEPKDEFDIEFKPGDDFDI